MLKRITTTDKDGNLEVDMVLNVNEILSIKQELWAAGTEDEGLICEITFKNGKNVCIECSLDDLEGLF